MSDHRIADRVTGEAVCETLSRFREQCPRVHCITNSVAGNFTANVLLAAGAIPSMTINPEEMRDFVGNADALLINLGTLDPLTYEAIDVAIEVASGIGRPWALDPVFVERSRPRLALAKRLVALRPTVIRSNATELSALADINDSGDALADAFAVSSHSVVVRTGAVDYVTDGARSISVSGGHPHLARITAAGCAATALMAGILAVENDSVLAAATCLAFVSTAAEKAGELAAGPGSFIPSFVDALYQLTPEEVGAQARIT